MMPKQWLFFLKKQNANGIKKFCKFLDASSHYRTLLTAVSHRPINNSRVSQGIMRFGFVLEDEIEVYSGLTFGIYKKSLMF